jgi:hypothetical protein
VLAGQVVRDGVGLDQGEARLLVEWHLAEGELAGGGELGLGLWPVGDRHKVVVYASVFEQQAGHLGAGEQVEIGEGGLGHGAGHVDGRSWVGVVAGCW